MSDRQQTCKAQVMFAEENSFHLPQKCVVLKKGEKKRKKAKNKEE